MNTEYSQQGGMKFPPNGLALGRAFQAGDEVLATPVGAENGDAGNIRAGLGLPFHQPGNECPGEQLQCPGSSYWGRASPTAWKSQLTTLGLARPYPPSTHLMLQLVQRAKTFCLRDLACEMGCWLKQTHTECSRNVPVFDRKRPSRTNPPS